MGDGEQPAQPIREEEDDFALDTTPLDTPGTSPPAVLAMLRGGRARVATLGATALLVALVVMELFAHATSDPRAAVATLLRLAPPTSPAPLPLSAGTVYFSDGAPWGTLTVDGQRLPSADLTGAGVSFRPGAHQLIYQARYFPSLRCVFSAPRAPSDTCPVDTSDSADQFLLGRGLARIIDLGSTGATLQPDQRLALTRLADDLLGQQALTSTIAPGARYVDDHGQLVTATAPLQFTLTFALDSSEAADAQSICYQFCPDPTLSSSPPQPDSAWATRVTVVSFWAVTDASGHSLTSPGYEAGLQYPSARPYAVGLRLTSGGWRIDGLTHVDTPAVISAAAQELNAMESGAFGVAFLLGKNPLDGCVMDVSPDGQAGPPGEPLRLLWRYGALLAVSASAQRHFPRLPVANAAEQAVAAHIAQVAQSQGEPPA